MSCFGKSKTYGNPENKIGPRILTQEAQKPMNLNFVFQGCQKMHIRVAISWSDGEIHG